MQIQKNIAATIRKVMDEENKTLEEYSDELGIGRTSLQGYLSEKSNPRADTIQLLADGMHMTPAELVSGSKLRTEVVCGEQSIYYHPLVQTLAMDVYKLTEELRALSDKLYAMEEGETET